MLKQVATLLISTVCASYLVACSGESSSSSKSTNKTPTPVKKNIVTTTKPTTVVATSKPASKTFIAQEKPIVIAKADTDEKKKTKKKKSATLNLCAGSKKGTYYDVGKLLATNAKSEGLTINVIETAGSLKNLQKMIKKKCDAAIIQSDTYFVFKAENSTVKLPLERVSTLFEEYVHLICNRKAKVADIGVFEKKRNKNVLLIGAKGSGTALTWKAFTLLDKDYAIAKTKKMGGTSALAKIIDGSEAQCMLQVDALKSPMMKKIDAQGKLLKLSPVNDWDFDNKKGPNGKKIYTFAKIPSGTYPKMQGSLFKGKKTLKLEAVLVVSKKWLKKNKKAKETLTEVVVDSSAQIKKFVIKRK